MLERVVLVVHDGYQCVQCPPPHQDLKGLQFAGIIQLFIYYFKKGLLSRNSNTYRID